MPDFPSRDDVDRTIATTQGTAARIGYHVGRCPGRVFVKRGWSQRQVVERTNGREVNLFQRATVFVVRQNLGKASSLDLASNDGTDLAEFLRMNGRMDASEYDAAGAGFSGSFGNPLRSWDLGGHRSDANKCALDLTWVELAVNSFVPDSGMNARIVLVCMCSDS